MDWADRTEGRGNAGKIASSFFHPSGPSESGYLIQRKSLILQSKLARGAGRMPFHPVNPGSNYPPCRVPDPGNGPRLDVRDRKGGISRTAPPQLAPGLHSLPPILHIRSLTPLQSCSKGARGLSV